LLIFPRLMRPDVWVEWSTDLLTGLELADWIETGDKFSAWLFAPYALREGVPQHDISERYVSPRQARALGCAPTPAARENRNVAAITHVALDFDGIEDPLPILARVAQYRAVAWSTWSWGVKAGWRFRVVFAISRPVPAAEWPGVWQRLLTLFPEADRSCSDPSRIMFAPSCRPGAPRWRHSFHGPALDVDALPNAGAVVVNEHTEPLPTELLTRIVKRWWRAADVAKAALASTLKHVMDGVPFAGPGERDSTTFALICALVRELKNTSAESIAATFRPSLELMGAPSIEKVIEMVGRAERYNAEAATQEAEVQTPQSEIDPKLLAYLSALNVEDPHKALCLQRDREYWVLTSSREQGFQYVQCTREGFARQCADKWRHFGIRLVAIGSDGKTRKLKPDEIVECFGSPVESVVRSFDLEQPEIRRNGAMRELVLPAARKRPLEPTYSAEVDRWLTLMGGASEETLRDWISLAQDTTRPLAALVTMGPPGTGKSLIAEGLARIWTAHGTPKLDRCLGDVSFNDELTRCPIVESPEDLPRDFRGRVRSAEIRDFIQRSRHAINAKNRQIYPLEGYPRLVISGNSDRVLDFGSDSLTPDDLAAIQARLFVIKTTTASREYLNRQDVGRWIREDLIARHFLWLAENRQAEYRGRFGIETGTTFRSTFVAAQGLRSAVLEWLVKYLLNPSRAVVRSAVSGDALGVRLADVEQHWQIYVASQKPRTDRLALASRVFEDSGDGMLVVRLEDLTTWVRHANYCSQSEIKQAFAGLDQALSRKGMSVVR
jgi:hypothetical protein